jgi:hypothetical protein
MSSGIVDVCLSHAVPRSLSLRREKVPRKAVPAGLPVSIIPSDIVSRRLFAEGSTVLGDMSHYRQSVAEQYPTALSLSPVTAPDV